MYKTTAEKIKVMQAYANGEEVECKHVQSELWHTMREVGREPEWDWSSYEYRIKPKIKTVQLHWAVLMKSNGNIITTNPRPLQEHINSIEGYRATAQVLKEYFDDFEVPINHSYVQGV